MNPEITVDSNTIARRKTMNWKHSYVSDIVKHFKRFRSENDDQFERLSQLQLNLNDIHTAFSPPTANDNNTIDFNIMLGIEQSPSIHAYTFTPVLTITRGADVPPIEFQSWDPPSPSKGSAEVPYHYLQWVSKNWREHNAATLGEVFESRFTVLLQSIGDMPVRREKKRLLGYYFQADLNTGLWKFINEHRGVIQKFVFHMGIDLNKEPYADAFPFSPVFEVVVPKLSPEKFIELHYQGARIRKAGNTSESIYFEYTSPCPSSCPNEQ